MKPLRPSARCSSLSSGQPWASACSSVSVQQGVRFVTLGSSACSPKRSRCSRGKQRAASRIAYGPEMGSTMEQSAGHVLAMALIASSGKGSVHSIDSSGAFDGNAREKEMMRDRVTVLPSMRRERSRHSFAIWRQASAVRSRQRSMRSVCTRGKCVASSIGPTSVQPERVRILSDDEMSSSPLNALLSSPWSSRCVRRGTERSMAAIKPLVHRHAPQSRPARSFSVSTSSHQRRHVRRHCQLSWPSSCASGQPPWSRLRPREPRKAKMSTALKSLSARTHLVIPSAA